MALSYAKKLTFRSLALLKGESGYVIVGIPHISSYWRFVIGWEHLVENKSFLDFVKIREC